MLDARNIIDAQAKGASTYRVLEVYGGFNSPCYLSEETTNSDHTIPRALMLGVLVVVGIYLAVNAALVHVLSTTELAGSPLAAADALAKVYGPSARVGVAVLAVVATLSVLNALRALGAPHSLRHGPRWALRFIWHVCHAAGCARRGCVAKCSWRHSRCR